MEETTKKITGVLVNPAANTAEEITIDHSLEGFYKALDCSYIDIVTRKIAGKRFDIICDDEALLHGDPIPAASDAAGRVMLFNRLFVVRYDGAESVRSLKQHEAAHVLRCTRSIHWGDKTIKILYPVEY